MDAETQKLLRIGGWVLCIVATVFYFMLTATPSCSPGSAGCVWVNTRSGIYHEPGTRWYGDTSRGRYMTEDDASRHGYRESENGQ